VDLRELGTTQPEGHWYYENKYSIILSGLPNGFKPSRIVEVGAGSKFFIKKLLERFTEAKGWAVDPYFTGYQLEEEQNLVSILEPPSIPADLYLFLDVLEHVEDDQALITESTKYAEPQAYIVVTVPAFKHLWSGHDVFLGHHRRYTQKSLRKVLEASNLKVLKISYTFSILYPIALIMRKFKPKKIESDMKPQSKVMNFTILNFISIFRALNSNRFFGLTVFAIAEKL
jgi:hypothetical protein